MNDWGARLIRLFVIALAASFLWACEGDDGADGARGPQGEPGDDGIQGPPGEPAVPPIQIGDGSTLTQEDVDALGQLVVNITGVTVASAPEVTFTVVDQHGNPAQGLAPGVVQFTFAKLVPNTGTDFNGGLPYWQNYINRVEDTTGDEDVVKPDVLDLSVQATSDSSGELVESETAPGEYTYTFATDVTNVTAPIAVAWEPNLTHRVGVEIRLAGTGVDGAFVEVPLAPDNDVYDWVPDGGAGSGVTKNIAVSENCNACHETLQIHGGPRKSVEYCVTCHNPGTVDQDTGESMDMAYLAHSIHLGQNRPVDFVVYGYGERFFSANDFSHVRYPGSVAYCEACHDDSKSTDGNNWTEGATAKACGGCHADGLVAANFDEVTGIAEYSFDHTVASDFPGGDVQPDGSCSGCHLGNIPVAGDPESIHSRLSERFANARERWRADLGKNFNFNIIDATNLAAGQTPVITFSVTDADGEFWNILTAPEFDEANDASMNLYVSWPGYENYNGGEGGATGGNRIAIDEATGQPGETTYMGAGGPHRMELGVIQYYIANNVGASQDNGDGTYTVSYFASLPEDFTGQAMVAIGGHPVALATNHEGTEAYSRAAPTSVVWYPDTANTRDFAVAAENCNACHQVLQMHGSNRNGNPEMCLVCHNADLANNDSFALGSMVHAIHTHDASFRDGRFEDVHYPQATANCESCHVEGKYNAAREVARSVSLARGEDATIWTDDIATTPTSKACGSCHTSVAQMGHFNTQGGAVAVTKDTIQKVGGLPNGMEACAVCHGPGKEFDTTKYHNPRVNLEE